MMHFSRELAARMLVKPGDGAWFTTKGHRVVISVAHVHADEHVDVGVTNNCFSNFPSILGSPIRLTKAASLDTHVTYGFEQHARVELLSAITHYHPGPVVESAFVLFHFARDG